jgi:hypothetical protein
MCSSSCKYDPKEGKLLVFFLLIVDLFAIPTMSLLDATVVALISSSFVRSMHDDDDDVDDDDDAVRSTVPALVHTGDICNGQ